MDKPFVWISAWGHGGSTRFGRQKFCKAGTSPCVAQDHRPVYLECIISLTSLQFSLIFHQSCNRERQFANLSSLMSQACSILLKSSSFPQNLLLKSQFLWVKFELVLVNIFWQLNSRLLCLSVSMSGHSQRKLLEVTICSWFHPLCCGFHPKFLLVDYIHDCLKLQV